MAFYTAEANGRPFVVFAAVDETDALRILNNPMLVIELSTLNNADGKLIWAGEPPLQVRPATNEESAKWWSHNSGSDSLVRLIEKTTVAPTRPGLTPFTSKD